MFGGWAPPDPLWKLTALRRSLGLCKGKGDRDVREEKETENGRRGKE